MIVRLLYGYMCQNYCFRVLLQFIQSGDIFSWKGYFIAAMMFLFNVAKTVVQQAFMYHAFNAGMHLKTVVTAMVYRKVLFI